jgi:uncharacterized protein (DUF488 family)
MPKIICTIGFAKKPLKTFVQLLKDAGVTKLVDTRLNNTSQLAGFAKKNDLAYIMDLVGIKYVHESEMAPTSDILKEYKSKKITWSQYENAYTGLLEERHILDHALKQMSNETICYLCSEDKPHHCHRRLLAEYIQQHNPTEIKIHHLV